MGEVEQLKGDLQRLQFAEEAKCADYRVMNILQAHFNWNTQVLLADESFSELISQDVL